jgi:hypothetical protein
MSILRQEEEGDEDAEAEEAEKAAAAKEPKKKVLKPPGYKKPPLPKPRPKDSGPTGKATPAAKRSSIGPEDFAVERRTVRESTRQKVEEGELERKLAEKVGGGRGVRPVGLCSVARPCTWPSHERLVGVEQQPYTA